MKNKTKDIKWETIKTQYELGVSVSKIKQVLNGSVNRTSIYKKAKVDNWKKPAKKILPKKTDKNPTKSKDQNKDDNQPCSQRSSHAKPAFKMDDNQKKLFELLKPLQKEIALNSISGMNDIDAYKASKGKSKTIKSMEASVSQILSNLKVRAFIESMANNIVNSAIMSRDEMMEELSLVARTNSNDLIDWGYRNVEVIDKDTGETKIVKQSFWTLRSVDEINPEHMSAIEEVSVGKDGLKFKRTSKLSAMKQLAGLGGYDAPIKIDNTNLNLDINAEDDPKLAAQKYAELIKNK